MQLRAAQQAVAPDPRKRRGAPFLGRVNGRVVGRIALDPDHLPRGRFRVFFFSREESRLHVHVHREDGEAKFWLEPQIQLAQNYGLDDRQIRAAEALVRKDEHDIRAAWRKHFGR